MPSQSDTQEQPSTRPGVLTLVIASASSVVAAILVSKLWGPGTVIGAAATPVIVTFVGELLKKPAEKITVVRVSPSGTQVHERTAPPPPTSPRSKAAPEPGERRSRRPLVFALATGLAAFVIGAVVLTGSELVFGDSSVASGGKRTTIFSGSTPDRPTPKEQKPEAPTPSVETTTAPAPGSAPEETETETAPAETTPPAAPGTSGPTGAAPPETGATGP
jgi:hypothetical protein